MCMFQVFVYAWSVFSPNSARLLTAYSIFSFFLAKFREFSSFRWSGEFFQIYTSLEFFSYHQLSGSFKKHVTEILCFCRIFTRFSGINYFIVLIKEYFVLTYLQNAAAWSPVEFQLARLSSKHHLRMPGLEFVIRSQVFMIAEMKKLICSFKYSELN